MADSEGGSREPSDRGWGIEDSQKRAILHFIGGAQAQSVKLPFAGTILGRENGDILVEDQGVSSSHCLVEYIKGDYYLFDMNSSNGTFVNAQPIVKQQLKDGDTITIGKTSIRFELALETAVRGIPTTATVSRDFVASQEKTSIVGTLLGQEERLLTRWGIHIRVTYGDGHSESYPLPQASVFVGRASSFGRFEQDTDVSRRHLLVKLNDSGEIFVEDAGSTNGSYLNGELIHGIHQVLPTDEIRIGSCLLMIHAFARET